MLSLIYPEVYIAMHWAEFLPAPCGISASCRSLNICTRTLITASYNNASEMHMYVSIGVVMLANAMFLE